MRGLLEKLSVLVKCDSASPISETSDSISEMNDSIFEAYDSIIARNPFPSRGITPKRMNNILADLPHRFDIAKEV